MVWEASLLLTLPILSRPLPHEKDAACSCRCAGSHLATMRETGVREKPIVEEGRQ